MKYTWVGVRGSSPGRSPDVGAAAGGLPGLGDLDGVTEFVQLGYQPTGVVLFVVAGGAVVLTEVGEDLAGGKHVPDGVEKAVGDRDGCLVRAAAAGYLPVLGAEVASFGARRTFSRRAISWARIFAWVLR